MLMTYFNNSSDFAIWLELIKESTTFFTYLHDEKLKQSLLSSYEYWKMPLKDKIRHVPFKGLSVSRIKM